MVVDRPRLEIEGCKCVSEDVKRVFSGMVRSHNQHLAKRKSDIRWSIGERKKEGNFPELLATLEDEYAKVNLDQQLMENLQDLIDDLPTCFEFHHGDRDARQTSKELGYTP